MSTSGKRLLTHFVCTVWKSLESTFYIMLRPHIVRLFPSHIHSSFNFHSILLQLLLSINTQLEIKPCSQRTRLGFRYASVRSEKTTWEKRLTWMDRDVNDYLWTTDIGKTKITVKSKYWHFVFFEILKTSTSFLWNL